MSEMKLEPCPRCGGEASFGLVRYGKANKPHAWFVDGTPVEIAHYVNCIGTSCGLSNQTLVGGFQTQELAAQHWNVRPAYKRAIADAVAAERERCLRIVMSEGITPSIPDDPDPIAEAINGALQNVHEAIRSASK